MTVRSVAIKDFMRGVPVTFTPGMDVLRAIHLLLEQDVSGAPVLDKLGNIVGFLSEKDAMTVAINAGYYEDAAGTVDQFMSTEVVTVDAQDSIVAAARLFRDASYKTLPVMLDSRLVGMLTRRDVLRAFERYR